MGILFANNVNMQLAADLAADDTSFSVIAGQGSQCPEIATDSTDYMFLKIRNKYGLDEIVKIIEHELNSDTFTIGDSTAVPHTASTDGRAYEETFGGYQTALAITASDKHKITMPVTAATLEAALVVYGSGTTTDDFKKLHAITSTHTEINQLHESGVVTADLEKLHDIAGNRTIGDIITETSAGTMGAIAAGAANTWLGGNGAGVLPSYKSMTLSGGIKLGTFTLDTSTKTITGVGFQPVTIIFLALSDGASTNTFSIGFDDGTAHYCICGNDLKDLSPKATHSIYSLGATGYITGIVSALSEDGFTVSSISSGTVPASPSVFYMAFK